MASWCICVCASTRAWVGGARAGTCLVFRSPAVSSRSGHIQGPTATTGRSESDRWFGRGLHPTRNGARSFGTFRSFVPPFGRDGSVGFFEVASNGRADRRTRTDASEVLRPGQGHPPLQRTFVARHLPVCFRPLVDMSREPTDVRPFVRLRRREMTLSYSCPSPATHAGSLAGRS